MSNATAKRSKAGRGMTAIQQAVKDALKRRNMTPYALGQAMKLHPHSIYSMLSKPTNVRNIQAMFDILGLKVIDPKAK